MPISNALHTEVSGVPIPLTVSLANARNFNDKDRAPDINIKCNTFVIIQNDIDDLKIAFAKEMMANPLHVDKHPDDNVAIFRGKIEGVWLSHAASPGKNFKILYGDDFVWTHAHKTVYLYEEKPSWQQAAAQTAPVANTALVTKAVSANKEGKIYGYFISAQEANDFLLKWTSGGNAKSKRIILPSANTQIFTDTIALNEGIEADAGTNITIENVNAGTAGKIYQADVLVAED